MKVVLKAFSIFIFLIFFYSPVKAYVCYLSTRLLIYLLFNVSVKWLALLGSILVSFSCSLLLAYVC